MHDRYSCRVLSTCSTCSVHVYNSTCTEHAQLMWSAAHVHSIVLNQGGVIQARLAGDIG